MRQVIGDELLKVDSKKDTITKWDKFLKSALWNMGFKQETIDNMYPYTKALSKNGREYEAGIPMIDGSTIPVGDHGRIFFKNSIADKLAHAFSYFKGNLECVLTAAEVVQTLLLTEPYDWLSQLFPDADIKDEKVREELINSVLTDIRVTAINSEIDSSSPQFFENNYTFTLTYEMLEQWVETGDKPAAIETDKIQPRARYCIIFTKLNTIYGNIDKEKLESVVENSNWHSGCYSNLSNISNAHQLWGEEYTVLSLNPIDKLMCSTKQPFGSCISLAKEKDNRGSNSTNALGLPSLFPNSSIFVMFTTNGKHKNMYWEEEEWFKKPEERDKAKAYKYFKMTSRNWVYKTDGKYSGRTQSEFDSYVATHKEQYDEAGIEEPRLLIGRTYTIGNGNDNHLFASVKTCLFDYYKIATQEHYADKIKRFRSAIRDSRGPYGANDSLYNTVNSGELLDPKGYDTDRYGNTRGMYFDNVSFKYKNGKAIDYETNTMLFDYALVRTGRNRTGSCGCASGSPKSELDAFKFMLGIQNYSYYDRNIKICKECGTVLAKEHNKTYLSAENMEHPICDECAEKLELQFCEDCNIWYKKENTKDHERINVMRIIKGDQAVMYPEKMICKTKLSHTKWIDSYGHTQSNTSYLCAHCGSIHFKTWDTDRLTYSVVFEGIEVRMGICQACFKDAYVCDKCHKLVVIDSVENAAMLLPDRRVVCSSCVETLRLKDKKKKSIIEFFRTSSDVSFAENTIEEDETIEQKMLARYIEKTDPKSRYSIGYFDGKFQYTKGVQRESGFKKLASQITSLMRKHSASEINTPVESRVFDAPSFDEIVSPSVTLANLEEMLPVGAIPEPAQF